MKRHDSPVEVQLSADLGISGDGDNGTSRPELGNETPGVAGGRQDDDGLGLDAVGGFNGGNGDSVGCVLMIELGLEQ